MTFEEWLDKWHIQNYDMTGVVGDGWVGILDRLASDLVALGWDRRIVQVKQKYGTLRFYLDDAAKPLRDRVKAAEIESAVTCERCGAAGGVYIVARSVADAIEPVKAELRRAGLLP